MQTFTNCKGISASARKRITARAGLPFHASRRGIRLAWSDLMAGFRSVNGKAPSAKFAERGFGNGFNSMKPANGPRSRNGPVNSLRQAVMEPGRHYLPGGTRPRLLQSIVQQDCWTSVALWRCVPKTGTEHVGNLLQSCMFWLAEAHGEHCSHVSGFRYRGFHSRASF